MAENDNRDLKEQLAQERQELREEKKELAAKEAIQEETQEEIRNFAETSPEMGPNSFWGSGGTWWILGIAGILIIFLVIWVCFFYGPN